MAAAPILPPEWPDASDPRWLQFHFRRCRPWLQAALDAMPIRTHEAGHLWAGLVSGELQIWPTLNSAVVTQISDYPTGVKVLHGLLAGGDLTEIKQTVLALEDHARASGCHYAAPQGREGWVKALEGYKRAYSLFYKELA